MSDDSDPILPMFAWKLPFFILGVVIGMAIVWVSFLWVPGVMRQVAATIGG